jgi:hypothetical protein
MSSTHVATGRTLQRDGPRKGARSTSCTIHRQASDSFVLLLYLYGVLGEGHSHELNSGGAALITLVESKQAVRLEAQPSSNDDVTPTTMVKTAQKSSAEVSIDFSPSAG